MTTDLPAGFAATRNSLHALAEQVLAAARHRSVGRIGLQVVEGGIGTPAFGPDRRTVAVLVGGRDSGGEGGRDGGEVVVRDDGGERRAPVSTVQAAADLAGVSPGAPAGVYPPATKLQPDAVLPFDADAARVIVAWYALGDAALRRFAPDAVATLWPEHLDLAIRAEGVNYGLSAGDAGLDEPYLYVGPDAVPGGDPFWNEPYGAARTRAQVATVDAAVAFFTDGRRRLTAR